MNSYTVLIPILIFGLVLPCVCRSRKRGPIRKWSRSWDPIRERLDRLDDDVNNLNFKVPEIEGRLENKVDIAREDLKEELMEFIVPGYIENKVEEYLADLLSGRGIEDFFSGYMMKHMINLRGYLHQMRKRNTLLTNRMAVMEDEMHQMKKRFVTDITKIPRNVSQDVSELTRDLNTTRVTLKKMDIEIEENRQERNNSNSWNNLITTKMSNASLEGIEQNLTTSPPPRTISGTVSASHSTTTNMDMLVAPFASVDYSIRLDLNNFAVSNFPPLIDSIYSIIYVSSLRSLLISNRYEGYILATINIDTHSLKTVKKGIASYGITIDEERQLVFLTTVKPTRTISRMEISGWTYKEVINTIPYGAVPLSLAVDPEQQKIYACLLDKLVSVDYSGNNVQTLYTGRYIRGVSLFGDALYFTVDKLLMKRSLSNNINKKLLTISSNPSTIVYYNSTLYALDGSDFIVIHVGDENNVTAQYGLVKILSRKYSMCLIPAKVND